MKQILGLRTNQLAVYHNSARFRILVAGRRFGKTQIALTDMLNTATKTPSAKVWYIAPSYQQAKDIAWSRLKQMSRPYWSKPAMESELKIFLNNRSTITLKGADRPDSLRGSGLDLAILDEFANMRPETWYQCILPALSDRTGRALFISTPKGHNHLYDLFTHAQHPDNAADWATFQFTTAQGGILTSTEIGKAAKNLDVETFRQEYEGEFTGSGHSYVYYNFKRDIHVKPLTFDGWRPLGWAIDFNVNPMCMLLIQRVANDVVHVLDEICLYKSNTEEACRTFVERISPQYKVIPAHQMPLKVDIFGDASGNQHRTSASSTDWEIVRSFFSRYKGRIEPSIRTNSTNPAVRDRVNCVNSRLMNLDQEVNLFIDPRCRELITDLERVVWCVDRNGRTTTEIDKSDQNRTHMSDALGYFIAQVFPLKPPIGPKSCGPLLGLSVRPSL